MFHIEGCDSVVGFKANLGKFFKIVKMNDNDELEKLLRKIRSEVTEKPRPEDYNLDAFARHMIIESTSSTLLNFISCLIRGCHHQAVTDLGSVHSAAHMWCRKKADHAWVRCETTPRMAVKNSSRLSTSMGSEPPMKCCAFTSQ